MKNILERIFEPFVQLGGSSHQMREGTGLGLSVSRQLARLLGGDLRATSEVGHGTTFTLVVPQICTSPRRGSH